MAGSKHDEWSTPDPRHRIDALLDGETFRSFEPAGVSPSLARWNIAAQADDGVVTGSGRLCGRELVVAAQDGRFLGGSIGAAQASALAHAFALALERRLPLLLVLESGGVRLYEANAAELGLARALAGLLALRVHGIPTIALIAGACFGGASVIACACDRLMMLPRARLGLSGPKVIEASAGKDELDASDAALIEATFGTAARVERGIAHPVDASAPAMRAAVIDALEAHAPLDFNTASSRQEYLRQAIAGDAGPEPCGEVALFAELMPPAARPLTAGDWLWGVPGSSLHVLMPSGACAVGPAQSLAMTAAVLHFIERNRGRVGTLVILEDSPGHEVSRKAERVGLSRFLAHHAGAIAVAKAEGHRVLGLLAGVGHSAAFFVNALQADTLYALPGARVVAMEPAAIARVTRLTGPNLQGLLHDDPLLGQPVRHLAALHGLAGIVEASPDTLLKLGANGTSPS